MEPLNTLITLVKLTFGLGMDRDTRSLKQVEIVLLPPPEKGIDNPPRLRVNDSLAFERMSLNPSWDDGSPYPR